MLMAALLLHSAIAGVVSWAQAVWPESRPSNRQTTPKSPSARHLLSLVDILEMRESK